MALRKDNDKGRRTSLPKNDGKGKPAVKKASPFQKFFKPGSNDEAVDVSRSHRSRTRTVEDKEPRENISTTSNPFSRSKSFEQKFDYNPDERKPDKFKPLREQKGGRESEERFSKLRNDFSKQEFSERSTRVKKDITFSEGKDRFSKEQKTERKFSSRDTSSFSKSDNVKKYAPSDNNDRKDRDTNERPKNKKLFDDDFFLKASDRATNKFTRDKKEIGSDRKFSNEDKGDRRNYDDRDHRSSGRNNYKKDDDRKERSFDKGKFVSKGSADRSKSNDDNEVDIVRLNKFVAQSGLCSRRKAAELIKAGEIWVNGVIELNPAYETKETDVITHKSIVLKKEVKMIYLLMNKPKNIITTADDEKGRKTVLDLIAGRYEERVFPVGRLDRNTTGLLLLTNDGDLAKKLAHPAHMVKKVYQVELDRNITQKDLDKIKSGLELEDGIAEVDAIDYVEGGKKNEIGIEIHIGKNRIVRRIFESLGYEVIKLDRMYYGGLTKKDLPRGFVRELSEQEIIMLKHFTNKRKKEE